MKITIFNGSPHGKSGNTHIISTAFTEGAESAGAQVEHVLLKDKKIAYCLGCFKCWVYTPGECIIKDDMDALLPQFSASDIAVFATPVYVDNVSGLMKTFMDRLIPGISPYFELDEKGETRHVKRNGNPPKIVVISSCGFAEQSHFAVLRLLFQRVARNMHSSLIGEIYKGAASLLHAQDPRLKPLVDNYKQLVKLAAEQIVKEQKIDQALIAKLEEPLLPAEMYNHFANRYWATQLAKLK